MCKKYSRSLISKYNKHASSMSICIQNWYRKIVKVPRQDRIKVQWVIIRLQRQY